MRVSPWLVFVVSFAMTIWLWQTAYHDNAEIRKTRFHNRVALVTARIQAAVKESENVLRGCDGLFAVSPQVTRSEWRRYVGALDLEKTIPGMQGLGFAQGVFAADLASHVRNIQAEGFATYTVKPEGERAEYFPIVYLEPFRDRNLRAFGYDMFSEPARREAMERARDEASTAISRRVTLVQEIPDTAVQYGFLLYRPIYSADVSSATLDERRQMLTGFVYSSLRFGDFLSSVVFAKSIWMGIAVYDGDEADPAHLVYESLTDPRSEQIPASYVSNLEDIAQVAICDRTWTIKCSSLPSFDLVDYTSKPTYVLIFGFIISILLAGASQIMRSRSQTLQAVERLKDDLEIRVGERTEDLRRSNRLLRMLNGCNQTLVRSESESSLLETITDLIVRVGGYRMCWVGYAENDPARSIRPVASAGYDSGLESLVITWADEEHGRGPSGVAIRTGQPVICNDIANNHAFAPWRAGVIECGYASAVALPLSNQSRPFGMIAIYASQPNAFTSLEMAILEEMAGDLAFGIVTHRDRLAHRQSEETLCQSEKNLRTAQALAHLGNWTLNLATGEIWWSEEIHRLFGHDPALQTPTLQEQEALFSSDSWERLQSAIAQTTGSGTPYDLKLEYHRPNGTTGWCRALGQARFDTLGKVVELHGTLQDITDRKRMETELLAHQENLEHLVAKQAGLLKELEERYRVVIEKTGQIVYEMDVSTWKTTHLGAIEEVLGFSTAEFQLPFDQWVAGIHPDDLDQALPQIIAATKAPASYNIEYRYQRKDSGYRFILNRGVSFANSEGQVFRVIGTMADITDLKILEGFLLKKNRAFDVSLAANFITDINVCLTEANATFTRIWGYQTKEEVLGKPISDFLLNISDLELIMVALKDEGFWDGEFIARKMDGSTFIAHGLATSLHDEKEAIIGYQAAVLDITETRLLMNKLEEEKHRADLANRAKSAFLANMSHEIRTPMNAILGFSQVLARDPSLTPPQVGHVQTIISSGNHLLSLIDDILDISKVEAGQAALNLSPLSLRGLLEDLKMMVTSRAAAKDLQLLIEYDDNLPGYVLADGNKLRQILINLVGNAVKFTTTGRVSVHLHGESVDGKAWTGGIGPFRLVGEVEDTGPGIVDEDVSKIFSTFQQAGAGVKAGGTGLGLAISRGFARLMAGDITFTSQPGKGSCFRFHVLLESAESVPEIEHIDSKQVVGLKPGTGPFRALVVDDVPENCSLLSALLCPVSFEVREAANGVEALDIFQAWNPHIVLMDIRMPVMDGYEAIRRLRITDAGRKVPIIAVTASAFEEDKNKVMGVGADAFLRKPFQPEELFAEIGKLLGLQYIFADQPANSPQPFQTGTIAPEVLAALPVELYKAMRRAVQFGDMERFAELLVQVEKEDIPTARGLQALADGFEYDALLAWFDKREMIDE